MNGRVAAIGGLGAVVAAAAIAVYLSSTRPEPDAPASEAAPASAASAPRPSPAPPPAAVSPRSRPRPAGAAPADAPDPAPGPAAPDAAPATATLTIDSDVPGAEVFLDRVFIGVSPVTVPGVAPGSHRLNVTAAGFDGLSETIDVVAGPRTITVEFKAIRLDATARVVHKHAFGSCEGSLTATPDGLRYDTANRDDAFSVPLTGLDSFAVDYLERNLTLKVKGGRTYNFTDPEGNADRLFVFHRDVDKVRARLATGQ